LPVYRLNQQLAGQDMTEFKAVADSVERSLGVNKESDKSDIFVFIISFFDASGP
jgi:hypothetical protein